MSGLDPRTVLAREWDGSPERAITIPRLPGTRSVGLDWARDYWNALRPHTAEGAYLNFMMEEGQDRVEATYGRNYSRLRSIKKKYDPKNLFRVNQNIKPKA